MLSTVSGDNAVRRSDTVHPVERLAMIRFQMPGVNALGHKAIRQHRLQCPRRVGDPTLQSMLSNSFMTQCFHSWHLKSDPHACCLSLSHCTLPRVTAVDLIGHSELYGVNELYEFSVLSNQYGP